MQLTSQWAQTHFTAYYWRSRCRRLAGGSANNPSPFTPLAPIAADASAGKGPLAATGTGLLSAAGLASAACTGLAAFASDGDSAVGAAAGEAEGAEALEDGGLAEEGAGAAADEAAGEGVDEAGVGEAGVEGALLVCGLNGVDGVAYNKINILRLFAKHEQACAKQVQSMYIDVSNCVLN